MALRQLIVNAIEYSDDSAVITIRAIARRHDVLVSVEDHGCGIPKDEMDHLFEKYHRASNAHLKKPDGNGLGLYIVKGIIEKAVRYPDHRQGRVFDVRSWLGARHSSDASWESGKHASLE